MDKVTPPVHDTATILTFPKRQPTKADLEAVEAQAIIEADRPELVSDFKERYIEILAATAHLSRGEIAEALANDRVHWIEGYTAAVLSVGEKQAR
jgi:hypothetical protein